MVGISGFFRSSGEEKKESAGIDASKEEKSLDPPQEVPDLAMEQFPLDESDENTSYSVINSEKEVAEKKPLKEAPSIDIKAVEEKKEEKATVKPSPPPKTVEQQAVPPQEAQKPKIVLPPLENKGISEKKDDGFTRIEEKPQGQAPLPKDDRTVSVRQKIPPPKYLEEMQKEKKQSFFSTLKEKLEKRIIDHKAIDSQKVVEEMKGYQHAIMEKEKVLKEKAMLDSELAEKIIELELLEEGWYLLRKEIDSKQILLLEREKLIDEKVRELKLLMDKEKSMDKKVTMPPEGKWFILQDGRKIKTIEELKETLKGMEDNVFYHHVTGDRNDFSSWIRHVFENPELAERLVAAKTKDQFMKILEEA